MKKLAGKDPASSLQSGNNEEAVLEKKGKYENWRNSLKPLMSHLAEHKRLEEECRKLDENIRNMRVGISETKENLNEAKTNGADCEGELKQIRTFLSQAKGWVDSATRIANDRTKVKRSEDDLKDALVGDKSGRSLEEVEQSLESLVESKDKKNSEVSAMKVWLTFLVQFFAKILIVTILLCFSKSPSTKNFQILSKGTLLWQKLRRAKKACCRK